MATGSNPNILLNIRPPSTVDAFNKTFGAIQNFQNAPIKNRLLELQAQSQGQVVDQNQANLQQQAQEAEIRNAATAAFEIAPLIQGQDFEGAKRVIVASQLMDDDDKAMLLDQLQTNPQAALSTLNSAVTTAERLGVVKPDPLTAKGINQPKFIGTPVRVERDGQTFLSGIVQQPDGSFGRQDVSLDGSLVSTLGETAEEQSLRTIDTAGKKTTAVEKAKAEAPLGKTELFIKQQKAKIDKAKADIAASEGRVKRAEAIAAADDTIALIDSLIKHPGRKSATGTSSLLPTRPGGASSDFEADFNRLKGSAFLEAVQKLKGSGQISNTEGEAATQSVLGVELGQSEEGFVANLRSLRARIIEAKGRRAGTFEDAEQPSSGATQVGRFQVEVVN